MEQSNTVQKKTAGYSSGTPYPEIRVFGQNKYYAELLMDDYAGIYGELTAINQYKYHALTSKRLNKELAEMMNNIAAVEMHHLELLADAIQALGVNPVFRSGSTPLQYWNAEKLQWGSDVANRLKGDLELELNVITNYREHIKKIQDPGIQTLLRRIVSDELIHVRLLREAIDKYCIIKVIEKKDELQTVKTPARSIQKPYIKRV